jgi:thymidylate synthase
MNGPDETPHLCLHLTQRSCDTFLGVPYNIAGYAFVLSLLAHLSGLRPGIFSHMLVDAHFYCAKPDGTMGDGVGGDGKPFREDQNHVPMIEEQLRREPRKLPRLTISDDIKELGDIKALLDAPKDEILDMFKLDGYDPHPPIKGRVAV